MSSEPVGNGPRSTAIPNNSHKAREADPTPEPVEKEKVQKIIQGKVVQRKTPWYKRAAHTMIADDAHDVGDFVLTDVIVPAIRNLIRDVIVGGVDRTLFGTSQARRGGVIRGDGPVSSLRNKYHNLPVERPMALTQGARARNDFEEIVLDSRSEAVEIIEFLVNRIERYKLATVADLYDALGITSDFTSRSWGWTDLREANVLQSSHGWKLDLPRPDALR